MKLPGIAGTIKDLGAPTRRKFLQMGAATLLPKPPIYIGGILDLSESTPPMSRLPSPEMIFEPGRFGFGDKNKVLNFIKRNNPLFSPIYGELSYHQELNRIMQKVVNGSQYKKDFMKKWEEQLLDEIGNNNLQYLLNEAELKLELFGDFEKYPDPISSGIIEKPSDVLNMLGGRITVRMQDIDRDIEDMEIVIEMNKYNKMKFEARVSMGGDYDIYNEYDDHPNYMSLKDFNKWISSRFKGFSDEIEKRFPGARKLQMQQKELEEEYQVKKNRQLPIPITEFSELMDKILSGKIEVTDEVRHQVRDLLAL